ncbi:hypothetical protein BDZ91DRAFT_848037 [Kalaharituber pfeilii]|nr:hypothetical protein BDZ91DRAFT_848037 [Kalaharituber pfeilii]
MKTVKLIARYRDETCPEKRLSRRGAYDGDLVAVVAFAMAFSDELRHALAATVAPAGRSKRPRSPSGSDETSKRRRKYIETFPPGPPSSQGVPAMFAKLQGDANDNNPLIYCNRPYWASSTPVTLLHPIFGEFVDECQNYKLTEVDIAFVLELSTEMSKIYDTEAERAKIFRPHCFLITEAKREIGSTGSDPYLQAALYYQKFLDDPAAATPGSVLPCFHIFYFGLFLGFAGSVITDKIHMDILVPILPLCWHPHDIRMRTMAAQCFGAFKKAVEKLENYYKNELPAIEGRPMQPDQAFPYKCDYQSLENKATVRFKYKDQPIPKKLLFLAEADNGSKKCIKFTRRYSKDAHLSCASQGYAPALRGFEALPGEWYMVVMDMADIDVYKPYSIRNTTSSSANFPSVAALRPKVEEVIKHLHRNGLVHGDVRDSNLLVRTDDEVGCMLVDFDWAGKEGEARYPINVNRSDIRQPDEVRDGLPIKKEHDLEMIKIMFDTRTANRDLIIHG